MDKRTKPGPVPGLTRDVYLEQLASGETIASIERAWSLKPNAIFYWVDKWGLKGVDSDKAQEMLGQKQQPAETEVVEGAAAGLIALNAKREDEQNKTLTAKLHERNAAVDNLLAENKRLHEQLKEIKARAADYEQELARWAQQDTELTQRFVEVQEDRDNWKQETEELKRKLAEREQTIAELSADRSVLVDTIDKAASAGGQVNASDSVNHPGHYTQGGIETIDFIRAKLTPEEFRGYCKGNVMKYIARENLKGGDEDMRKAAVYLGWATEVLADGIPATRAL